MLCTSPSEVARTISFNRSHAGEHLRSRRLQLKLLIRAVQSSGETAGDGRRVRSRIRRESSPHSPTFGFGQPSQTTRRGQPFEAAGVPFRQRKRLEPRMVRYDSKTPPQAPYRRSRDLAQRGYAFVGRDEPPSTVAVPGQVLSSRCAPPMLRAPVRADAPVAAWRTYYPPPAPRLACRASTAIRSMAPTRSSGFEMVLHQHAAGLVRGAWPAPPRRESQMST